MLGWHCVRPVNIQLTERETRIRKAFDLIFDEILERKIPENKQGDVETRQGD